MMMARRTPRSPARTWRYTSTRAASAAGGHSNWQRTSGADSRKWTFVFSIPVNQAAFTGIWY